MTVASARCGEIAATEQARGFQFRAPHGEAAALGVEVFDLNDADALPVHVAGADEIDAGFHMIKGGAAAAEMANLASEVRSVVMAAPGPPMSVADGSRNR